MTALDIALGYIARGWSPVPIPYRQKRPVLEDWPSLRITAATASNYFNGQPQNIGIILGEASGGLADVDLDCPEAIAVAGYLLPRTDAIFGRPSARDAHRLYRVTEPSEKAVEVLDDPDRFDGKSRLVELRRGGDNGAQTVFPGSTHKETGEAITWETTGEPSEADADDLVRRVKLVAAAALLARGWPGEGRRHEASLTLGGFLNRAGISTRQAKLFAEAVSKAAGDPEWRDRVRAMEVSPGAHRQGFPALKDWLGEKRAKAVADWLGYAERAGDAGTADRDPEGSADFDPIAPRFSDEGLALDFATRHRDGLRYVAAWSRWLEWTGCRWQEDDTLRAFDLARAICREGAAACNNKSNGRISSAKTVAAVVSLARSDRRLAAVVDQWDADPWLLNTPGGVVDLRTGETRKHRLEDFMTKATAVTPGVDSPRWLAFLDRVTGGDRELRDYLQRLAGYALTGSTREHVLPYAHGNGGNGKGVFIGAIAGAMGSYHKTAPIETFTASNGDRHPTELAMLRGARLVTAQETEEGRRWAESRIKMLTGGDVVSARFMRGDFFEFQPQFTLLIAGNHKPGLRSVDEAIRRRFHLIPFTVTIGADERDETLPEKLKAEWPGILAWAIEGCLEWQRQGLNPPAVVRAATDAYLDGQDALGAWLEEACDVEPNAWTARTELYASWQAWAERSREFVLPRARLFDALEARGFADKRQPGKGTRGFQGLRVRQHDYSEAHWNR
jgi:putative DNA primase/helicase